MQVFKLHFNPKIKEDRYFNSFSFEPENSYEKSAGNLYLAGELENATLKNSNFLEKTSQSIKKKYYSASFKKPNKALAESLKAGNDFLSEEIKKENVGWLGNLNLAALAIKDFELSFTATGSLKILLLRGGQINDISKDLNATEIEPFPLKVFFNVVSGKLIENDIILAISKDLFDLLTKKNIIEKIANSESLNEKKLKEIFPNKLFKETDGLSISGVCLIADLGKKKPNLSSKSKEMTFEKTKADLFSKIWERIKLFNIYSYLPKFSKKIKNTEKKTVIPIKTIKNETKPNLKLPSFKNFKNPDSKRNTTIIIALIVILILGFTVFRKNEQIRKEKISEAADLKKTAEEKLLIENKMKRIDNPDILADIDIKNLEFLPQTLLISGYKMYLSSPISPNLYVFDLNAKKGNVFKYNQNLELSDDSSSIILFFSGPDKIISFENEKFREGIINIPKNNFDFDLMSSYASNIYFLDKEKNEIIKYSYNSNFKWADSKTSFSPKEKTKSLAIDSYFWLLNEDNGIDIYYKGEYQKTINTDIYPKIKNLTKIKTKAGLPYVYLLEPINNRLIITDKNGKIIEQIQSEKFDNLKDFSISYNGSTIWILNGEQIFRVEM
jgi:hypothetical protein